jgi:hypothetical protein
MSGLHYEFEAKDRHFSEYGPSFNSDSSITKNYGIKHFKEI